MAKKRKLNSKNPKYWSENNTNKPKIKKKVLFCEVKGVKAYGVWYEDDKNTN
tara:strand:+ start:358 stop:513 length:156 start_codon:yes stop_codon:yes gene_type:complete